MRRLPPWLRAIVGAAVGFVLFALLASSAQRVYHFAMPGSWWLDYYYAHVDDVLVGQPPAVTLCRRSRYSDLKPVATRTFIYVQVGGRAETVSQYSFSPVLQQRAERCQTLHLAVSRQPQQAGTYYIHTSEVFYVGGYRKVISFDTNSYRLIETPTSIQNEINQLQSQIDALRALLQSMTGLKTTSSQTSSMQAVRSSQGTSLGGGPVPLSPQPTSTLPPSSSGPSPSSLLQPMVDTTTTLLNQIPGIGGL